MVTFLLFKIGLHDVGKTCDMGFKYGDLDIIAILNMYRTGPNKYMWSLHLIGVEGVLATKRLRTPATHIECVHAR